MKQPSIAGITVKKKYGQHFLKDQNILNTIIDNVSLDETSSVFEIGGGSGVLTKTILTTNVARLWVFEIDHEWAEYLKETINDKRLTVFEENILDVDFSKFESYKPWTLLANLPYQVTFPILHMLIEQCYLLKEGVIMVQEEVAQKIIKTQGRDYGYVSLFFQYYFDWKLLNKIPPGAFYPPPKVYSRLLYFKPKQVLQPIFDEEKFWQFVKVCFKQPRRTIRNNLKSTHYNVEMLSDELLEKRAQQLNFEDLLNIWKKIH